MCARRDYSAFGLAPSGSPWRAIAAAAASSNPRFFMSWVRPTDS
jgi:hypothetical protein